MQVLRLKKDLQTCNIRISQMQTRLMATLDELDASRNAHHYELKAEKRAKERLSEKLDRYLDEVKRAEAEKDEMREVVSILVEKGTSAPFSACEVGICQNQRHRESKMRCFLGPDVHCARRVGFACTPQPHRLLCGEAARWSSFQPVARTHRNAPFLAPVQCSLPFPSFRPSR